jgi:hypothetical protein
MYRFLAASLMIAALVLPAGCGKSNTTGGGTTSGGTASMSTQQPATVASGGMENAPGAVPNCGAVKAVWANTKTKVYHEPGDPMYGNTKHGEYLCPSQAKKEGYRPAHAGKPHKPSM